MSTSNDWCLNFQDFIVFDPQDILEDDPDAGDVMDCLIKHKHHRDMNEKCAAGVEHHQLVSTVTSVLNVVGFV